VIGVSIGTASILGLSGAGCDVPPTTAHLMVGGHCMLNCAFCAQARRSRAGSERLSRVTWPPFEAGEVFARIAEAHRDGVLKRACVQVINSRGALRLLEDSVSRLRKESAIPLSVASNCLREREMAALFDMGADVIGLPLDCATGAL